MSHEFNDDPNTPLNKKIAEIIDIVQKSGGRGLANIITELCQSIFVIGFEEGQGYAYKLRQMLFIDDPDNPGKQKVVFPGDTDYPKDDFVCIQTGGE